MIDITIDLSEVTEYLAELQSAPDIINAEMLDAMDASLNVLEQYAVAETPVGATGHARQSIDSVIHGAPPNFRGEVVMGVPYGLPLEHGRKPGKWPPRAPIALWVRRKLNVPEEQVERVAFLIQRAIGARGTKPGAQMFAKAFDKGQPRVMRLWEEIPGRIIGRIGTG
jgi:hypothetical protein